MFTVVATGSPAPALQWRKDGNPLAGQTAATLTLANAQAADAGSYTCVATNSAGTVTSAAATLTVTAVVAGTAPVITAQPASLVAAPGATVTFTVASTGATGLQWRKNGTPIPGATAATLTLTAVNAAAAADYDVVLTNASGTTASASAARCRSSITTPRLYWASTWAGSSVRARS